MLQPAIRRLLSGPRRISFALVIRSFAILALAFVALSAAPLHAQARPIVHKVPPTYPPLAKQMRITGTVVVTATVDAAGKVLKAESTSGNKLLSSSAIDAVKQWRFAPGDAVETFPVSVNFEMDNN